MPPLALVVALIPSATAVPEDPSSSHIHVARVEGRCPAPIRLDGTLPYPEETCFTVVSGTGASPAILSDVLAELEATLPTRAGGALALELSVVDAAFVERYTAPAPIAAAFARIDGHTESFDDDERAIRIDLDLDGFVDEIVLDTGHGLATIRRGGPDGLAPAANSVCVFGEIDDLIVVDASSDGYPDLVTPSGESVLVRVGNGDGTFGAVHAIRLPSRVGDVACGDVDGDGRVDLVAALPEHGCLVTLMATGVEAWAWRPRNVTHLGRAADRIELVDVDGDGHLDLRASIASDATPLREIVAAGRGDGTFATPR